MTKTKKKASKRLAPGPRNWGLGNPSLTPSKEGGAETKGGRGKKKARKLKAKGKKGLKKGKKKKN